MNKIWILIWYIILMFSGIVLMWIGEKIFSLYLKFKEKQIRRKIDRYRKYGRIYRYEGVFKDVIN